MDDNTRYWLASDMADNKFQHNADNLLQLTKLQAGKSPRNFITDGLPAYMKSSKRIFGKNTNHIRHIHLKGDKNNNKMERLNGEIRDREKVFRGLKKMDTPIIEGMRVYYNFTKKHGSLNGQTPAESALIKVDGKNKWKTIIQNASLHKENSI
jgi:transposase-like protein